MKKIDVEFLITDWQRGLESIYNTEECQNYTDGDLHRGMILHGSVELSEEDADRLKIALSRRASPSLVIKI
jgi:hypothetical protein